MSPLSLLSLVFASSLLAPHDPGLSSIQVRVDGAAVHVHAAFANADFEAAATIDRDADGAITAVELANALPMLRTFVREQFVLRCTDRAVAGELLSASIAENRDVVLHLSFAAADGDAPLALDVGLLSKLSRGHRCYTALLDERDAILADALLRPAAATFSMPTTSVAQRRSGFAQSWSFFVLGVEHILIGFDHLAFLLALLAAGVTWRRVVTTITAFTAAHSITLLAAATGLVRLPGTVVEATIAASIVVVALANLWQRGRATHRWPLAFAFGLVHGFGFAGVLADLDIGGPDNIWPLLTFNVGVEAGQMLFALVVVPLLALATRRPLGRHVPGLVSVVVGIAGMFWLCQRLAE